mmetsp:Transcript_0/g.2  ORF Transcript_0/g.2 Transcript_0/m.2 type:complete len:234 (-) Transcript_0:504-1205(-)
MDGIPTAACVHQAAGARCPISVAAYPWIGVRHPKEAVHLSHLNRRRELLVAVEEIALTVGKGANGARESALRPLHTEATASAKATSFTLNNVESEVDLWASGGAVLCGLRQNVDIVGNSHRVDGVNVALGLLQAVYAARLRGQLPHDDLPLHLTLRLCFATAHGHKSKIDLSYQSLRYGKVGDPTLHVHIDHLPKDAALLIPSVQALHPTAKLSKVERTTVLSRERLGDDGRR